MKRKVSIRFALIAFILGTFAGIIISANTEEPVEIDCRGVQVIGGMICGFDATRYQVIEVNGLIYLPEKHRHER